jgi:uncharacterized protein (DUF952 family)
VTPPAASPISEPVFHIALASDWAAAQTVGEYRISTLGRTLDEQGYIHASFERQVRGVLTAFYSGVTEQLLLLRLDPAALPIVVEPAVVGSAGGARGVELFPHIYGPIPVAAVTDVTPVPAV